MILKNKNILIISPQEWGTMRISKHHYAVELAMRGNNVYFLNPPNPKLSKDIVISISNQTKNLKLISYRPFFPLIIRFHFRKLFDYLMRHQIRKLLKNIKVIFDVVWCFETNIYSHLKLFHGKTTIYHPVDQVITSYSINAASETDLVISVADEILSKFQYIDVPKYFINHGLSGTFYEFGKKNLCDLTEPSNNLQIKCGYAGNLLIPALDKYSMLEIIKSNQNVMFYFWGPYSGVNNNLAGSNTSETLAFIEKLKNNPNVTLRGPQNPEIVAREIQEMDVLLVCLDNKNDQNNGANSHKILEYLSTGKVVVSNFLSVYKDYQHLIRMAKRPDELPFTFKDTINNLAAYNSVELQKERIQLALENTYLKQIDRIERILV